MTAAAGTALARARQLVQLGQLAEAFSLYQQVLEQLPGEAVIHYEAGILALRQENHDWAIRAFERAVEIQPDQAVFHNLLGIAYSNAGKLSAGMRCLQQVLKLQPDNYVALNNLGSNYKDQGLFIQAIECYRRAIDLRADYLAAYMNLGAVLRKTGDLPGAEIIYQRAGQLDADSAEVKLNLAITLHLKGEHAQAVALLEPLVATQPPYPGALSRLALALVHLGRYSEALSRYRQAIRDEPGSAAVFNNFGNALVAVGEVSEAIECFRRALELQPDHAQAHSNWLLALNYLPAQPQSALYAAAKNYEARHAGEPGLTAHSFRSSPDPDRVLRIGYVSADFRVHSVAHFVRKLFSCHDRTRFEVFGYSNVVNPDAVTAEIKDQADHWRSITGLSDASVAEMVAADRIDILVDLGGHTAGNRLPLFARRPAPVQVTWLGYPNTTGLSSIDYRLSDDIADPPGPDDHWYAEQLLRLPDGFLCYQSGTDSPPVKASPFLENRYITFGSFNNLPKLTGPVVAVWSKILEANQGSRLVLKSSAFSDPGVRDRYRRQFGSRGVDPGRIDLLGLLPGRDAHLGAYSRIDIGLDPFPYNGTTTTCEALWMGVPVIALLGDRHSGRVGASLLRRLDLMDLVATDVDNYVEIACRLATDQQRLVSLRAGLRQAMQSSSLTDIDRFSRSLERSYRKIWIEWCERGTGG